MSDSRTKEEEVSESGLGERSAATRAGHDKSGVVTAPSKSPCAAVDKGTPQTSSDSIPSKERLRTLRKTVEHYARTECDRASSETVKELVEAAAVLESLEKSPAETSADLFDQYPVWTIFQKKEDGRIVAMTPDGKTVRARAPVKASGDAS